MAINGVSSNTTDYYNSTPSTSGKAYDLKAEDFINMMITQLKNQDPLEPAKNEELLAQMSQIGQLQSATTLQDSLKSMVVQNQIGSAAALIGKSVKGKAATTGEDIDGVVSSVKVSDDGVSLQLDNGVSLPLNNVTDISPTPAPTH